MPIISLCPDCKGSGKVLKEKPLMSNPRAPAAQAHRREMVTCPRCKGTGRLGIDLEED